MTPNLNLVMSWLGRNLLYTIYSHSLLEKNFFNWFPFLCYNVQQKFVISENSVMMTMLQNGLLIEF